MGYSSCLGLMVLRVLAASLNMSWASYGDKGYDGYFVAVIEVRFFAECDDVLSGDVPVVVGVEVLDEFLDAGPRHLGLHVGQLAVFLRNGEASPRADLDLALVGLLDHGLLDLDLVGVQQDVRHDPLRVLVDAFERVVKHRVVVLLPQGDHVDAAELIGKHAHGVVFILEVGLDQRVADMRFILRGESDRAYHGVAIGEELFCDDQKQLLLDGVGVEVGDLVDMDWLLEESLLHFVVDF